MALGCLFCSLSYHVSENFFDLSNPSLAAKSNGRDKIMRNNHEVENVPGHDTQIILAKKRTELAEVRTEQAEARTEQARTRTELAEARTEQAETRTELAKTRTEQAETRSEQAEA